MTASAPAPPPLQCFCSPPLCGYSFQTFNASRSHQGAGARASYPPLLATPSFRRIRHFLSWHTPLLLQSLSCLALLCQKLMLLLFSLTHLQAHTGLRPAISA